jgi:hypothetical protein
MADARWAMPPDRRGIERYKVLGLIIVNAD